MPPAVAEEVVDLSALLLTWYLAICTQLAEGKRGASGRRETSGGRSAEAKPAQSGPSTVKIWLVGKFSQVVGNFFR